MRTRGQRKTTRRRQGHFQASHLKENRPKRWAWDPAQQAPRQGAQDPRRRPRAERQHRWGETRSGRRGGAAIREQTPALAHPSTRRPQSFTRPGRGRAVGERSRGRRAGAEGCRVPVSRPGDKDAPGSRSRHRAVHGTCGTVCLCWSPAELFLNVRGELLTGWKAPKPAHWANAPVPQGCRDRYQGQVPEYASTVQSPKSEMGRQQG